MARRSSSGTEKENKRRLWWSFGATIAALALWMIISMSENYAWSIEVPLVVRIDSTNEALAETIPQNVRVTARGDGWTLMQMILDDDLLCRLDPTGRPPSADDSLRRYDYGQQELVRRINAPRSIRIEDVSPQNVRLVITDLARKRVPLVYDESLLLEPRAGFQVIGRPTIRPASVTLSGSPDALEKISFWRIRPVPLADLDAPTQLVVPVADSLHGVINVRPEQATLSVDIQEVAELTIENVVVINRGLVADTTTELVLYPDRMTVTLRGGADELGRLAETSVIARVDLTPERDSVGSVRPTILLPPYLNATVIATSPRTIRYVWRRSIGGRSIAAVLTNGRGSRSEGTTE